MEFIHLVVRQDVGLQAGSAAQGVAVNLQHLGQWHGVHGRVKVAHIGQQKLERVADAAVSVDHARQDFVVTSNVAGVVTGGHPQADDFGTELLGGFLRVDAVAGAFAHLVALAVHREPMCQDAFVGRAAVHGAGSEQ